MSEQVMTTEEFLAHYGVKGMRWGHRKARPTSDDIHDARIRIAGKQQQLKKQTKAVKTAKKSGNASKQAAAEKKLQDMKTDFLKNPDRVTASRLTKGEKWAVGILTVGTGPVGVAALIGGQAARSAVIKTVEKRQASGYYDKKK